MVSKEELEEMFSGLSDEELVRRVSGEDLTQFALEIAQNELNSRNINLSQFQHSDAAPSNFSKLKLKAIPISGKIVNFPKKAFLGFEPLWQVLILGLLAALAVNQIVVTFLLEFIVTTEVASFSFPILYILLGLRVLVYGFISIAIWRSAFNTKFKIFTIVAYACSGLLILFVLWSTYMTLDITKNYKPKSKIDIMENSVIRMQ